MAHIQVNVLREKDGVFKYSIDPAPPAETDLSHRFHVRDQITWRYWKDNQRVQVAFKTDICPFTRADGSPWPNKTFIFPDQPDQPAILDAGFDKKRLNDPIKYTITLPDQPGTLPDDPEVIIVDG